jgi:hypothetical protein
MSPLDPKVGDDYAAAIPIPHHESDEWLGIVIVSASR